ncbi:MAG: M56 family metallopeptidase [Bacteroides sp.]|nr:M56 family metallopeptidase [Roseburia sp.]MCM1462907.1 M56 family metallopeptidase [Bacteroides sp.]
MIGLFERNIAAGVLILAILLFRRVNRRLPGRYFTGLWGVAALRLILPFSVKILVPSAIAAGATLPKGGGSGAAAGTAEVELFPVIYYAVALAVFLGLLLRHLIGRRSFREAIPCTDEDILKATGQFIQVKVSDRVVAPLAYGLFRPVILLPKSVLADREGLELILAHELTHIRRGDLFYKLLLTAAASLGWLNPLAWVMLAVANRDLEIACDEAVLKGRPERRAEYARLLIRAEERKSNILSGAFSTNAVKERIERIMKMKKATLIGSIAAAVVAAGSLAVFVSAEAAKNTNIQWYVGGEDGELTPVSEEDAINAMDDENAVIYSIESDVSDIRVFASEDEGETVVYTVTSDSGEENELSTESEAPFVYYVFDEDGIVETVTEEEFETRKALYEGAVEAEPASSEAVEADPE